MFHLQRKDRKRPTSNCMPCFIPSRKVLSNKRSEQEEWRGVSENNWFILTYLRFVGYNELNDEEKAEIDQYFPKPQTEDGKKHKLENEDTSGTPIAKKAKVEDDESTRNALKVIKKE